MPKSANQTGSSNPSKNTQFKPGQSGNPNGRPRKKIYEAPQMTGLDILDQPFARMIEEEGLRPIEVGDGKGEKEEIPAFQAVMRSLVHQAAKGSRLAATQFVELFSSVQRERRAEKLSSLDSLLSMKLLASEHPDAPEVKLFRENGPDPDRARVNPNGLIDYGVDPQGYLDFKADKLEKRRDLIVADLRAYRDRLEIEDDELQRELCEAHIDHREGQLRQAQDELDRHLESLERDRSS